MSSIMQGLLNVIFTFGYAGLFIVLFAESGFLLGFFLPGDSLIFTAGILASQGYFNIYILLPVCVVSAILGDSFGYWCGMKWGPGIFNREESFLFSKKNVDKTRNFYDRHGKKTLILARFVPVVRTFAPIMAGVAGMKYRSFFTYNVIGGLLWGGVILMLGYSLGSIFPQTEKYLSYIIVAIVLLSIIPFAYEFLKKAPKHKVS